MATQPGCLLAGNLYFDTTKMGLEEMAEAFKFAIKANADIKELESKGRDSYGQVLATVALQRPAELSIGLRGANRESLTLAFMGEQAALNQGAGTVTDEASGAHLGKWVQLSRQNLNAAGFALTNTGGTTTYVLGTDYEVNYRLGMYRALAGGAIAEAQELLADFSYAAISGTRVRGAVRPQLRCALMLDGKNLVDDRPVICRVWEAVLTPSAEFDFLSDDWSEIELEGRLVTPPGKTSPFEIEFRD